MVIVKLLSNYLDKYTAVHSVHYTVTGLISLICMIHSLHNCIVALHLNCITFSNLLYVLKLGMLTNISYVDKTYFVHVSGAV